MKLIKYHYNYKTDSIVRFSNYVRIKFILYLY